MQVGMGASVKAHQTSIAKGRNVWYAITILLGSLIYFWARGFNQVDILIFFRSGYFILFYFIFIIKNASNSLKHFSEKSEQIFSLYGFKDPQEVFIAKSLFE